MVHGVEPGGAAADALEPGDVILEVNGAPATSAREAATRMRETRSGRPLLLKVERNGNYLQVSWDRNAPVVARSKAGTLLISDGPFRKEIKLEPAHLRAGTVAYAPTGEDVNFRLELSDGRRSVTESLRVVTATPADGRGMQPAVTEPLMPRTDEEEDRPQFKTAGQVSTAQGVPAENAIRPRSARKARVSRFFDDGL
jgi:membrane-associated protease RseP (regulator of RpoE activity)